MVDKNRKFPASHCLILTLGLLLGGLVLAGCDTYNGYPTAVPVTATPDAAKPTLPPPTETPQPTFPPLPSATPRPTLPATPANLTLKKIDVLQKAYSALLTNYYQPLGSSDIYEVGLIGIRDALRQAGVNQPDVPIPAFSGNAQEDWQTFLKAYTIVNGRYSSALSEDKMVNAALQRTVTTLGECENSQTAFYPADQSEAYLRNRSGQSQYTGVGFNIFAFDTVNGYYITRVTGSTPAEQSGIKVGDAIIAVDGRDVTKLPSSEVLRLLMGNAGAKVSLTLRRAGSGQSQTLDVTRATIQTQPVELRTLTDNIAYIRINSFPIVADDTTFNRLNTQLDQVLSQFASRGVKGYVLDLRGTRFGYIRLVQSYLSRFVAGQDLALLVTRDQQGQRNVIQMSSLSNVKAVDKPVAVLVDQTTSNEAEIFAQVIQSKRKGSVFGTATAGCPVASFPSVLPDNSVLNVSIYRSISDGNDPNSYIENVTPDVVVDIDRQSLSQGQDAQLEKAISFIKGQ